MNESKDSLKQSMGDFQMTQTLSSRLEEKEGLKHEVVQIIIDRVRHFRKFETPSLMKCIDEITFLNNTEEEIETVTYTLDDFLPGLHIFDSTGEQLEFYGSGHSGNKVGREIDIDFPSDKPLLGGRYKTLRFEYIRETVKNAVGAKIKIPLPEHASIYTFIEQCENYEFTVSYGILDKNKEEVGNVDLKIIRGNSFFNIYFKAPEKESNLYIILDHKVAKTVLNWYKMGAIFGFISAIAIRFLYHYNPQNVVGIATASSFVISYLFIIKGWLFTKNMDRSLKKMDLLYQILICLIFLEITIMLLHYSYIYIRN